MVKSEVGAAEKTAEVIRYLTDLIFYLEQWEKEERRHNGAGGQLIDAQNRLYGAEMALDILQAGSEYQEIATRSYQRRESAPRSAAPAGLQ
jgi:hypothetical protein